METLKINVYLNQRAALLQGRTSYGSTTYAPSEAELAELSPSERLALEGYLQGEYSHTSIDLDEPPTWGAIVAALRAEIQREIKEKEERLAEAKRRSEEAVAEFLDMRDEQILQIGGYRSLRVEDSSPRNLPDDDPRVVARRAELAPLRARLEAEVAQRKAAEEAKEKAREEAKEAIRRANLAKAEQLEQWARANVPGVAPGLDQDYNMESAIMSGVIEEITRIMLARGFGTFCPMFEGADGWDQYSWSRRSSPRPEALAECARFAETLKAIQIPGIVFQDPLVCRIEPDEGRPYTGLAVLSEPIYEIKQVAILVPLEDQE